MSLPQCLEGCPQQETRVRHKQRHRSRIKNAVQTSGNTQQIQDLRGGRGVQKFQGCVGRGLPGEGPRGPGTNQGKNKKLSRGAGGSRVPWGGSRRFQGKVERGVQKTAKTRKNLAGLLRPNGSPPFGACRGPPPLCPISKC